MISKTHCGLAAFSSLFALLVLVICRGVFASGVPDSQTSYTWTRSGPVVGRVNALSIAPSNPAIRYAGIASSSGGFGADSKLAVYKSLDSGATWSLSGLLDKTIDSLAVDPNNPNVVYAGTSQGDVFKSNDGGSSWNGPYLSGFGSGDLTALIIDGNNTAVLYAGVFTRGVFKSTDAGLTWNSLTSVLPTNGIRSLVMDPGNSNIIYAAGTSKFIYKSIDAGASWNLSNNGIADSAEFSSALALSPSNTSVLYKSTGLGVYKTTDSAASWTLTGPGLPSAGITSLAVDPANSAIVMAGIFNQGVFKTTDGGGTWNPTSLGALGVNTLTIETGNPNIVHAGSIRNGILKSTDAGGTWSQETNMPTGDVREITPDPGNPAVLYVNTSDGMYKTSNSGTSWMASLATNVSVLSGFPTHSLALDPSNPSTLYAASDFSGVFKTSDGGTSWVGTYQANININTVAIDPVATQNLYLATYPAHLLKSTNGGASWNPIAAPGDVAVLAVDPVNPAIVYAGSNIGVSKSTNGGTNWTLTSLPTGSANPYVLSLVLDPTNPAIVYAATYNGVTYKTVNGGLNWSPVFTDVAGHVLAFAFDPGTAGTVFVGTDQGVFMSTNGGQSSGNFSNGLPAAARTVMSLHYNSGSRVLYAGTMDGVYTLSLGPTVNEPLDGRVTDINGVGIAGVTMTVSGPPTGMTVSTLTDANGDYSFNNSVGGDTLTPSKTGYVFDPSSIIAVSSGGPVPITGTHNFIGGTATYTLTGRVIDGTGAGLSNIIVTVTGSQQRATVTDPNGNYAIFGLFAGGNYTFRPSQNGFVFLPGAVGFPSLPAGDRTVPTFVGTMHPYTISGQVKDNLNNPVSAVLLSLRRVGGNDGVGVSTNPSGNYSIANVASEATYTLTPSKAGFSFSPATVTFATPNGNQVANFTAIPFPTVEFSATNYDVGEGSVSVVVTVTRSGDTTIASTVDFASTNGTASQLRDYEVANGTISFAAGETSRTFRVLVVDDVFAETNETVNLTLSSPTGATLTGSTTATVTILDNDSSGTTSPVSRQFVSNLVGAEEVPATPNAVKGNGGIVQLSNDELSAKVSLLFSGLTGSETGAHVHAGAVGVNGPIIFPLPLGNPINNFVINPTSQQVADLRAVQQYMNVHSSSFLNGEIRGQLQWNPAEEADFFVRQAYFDFLSRVPDAGGFAFWTAEITNCQTDVECLRRKRVDVSNAFFYEQEFQQTAAYVLRLYRGAYGNNQPFPNPNPNAGFPNEEKKLPSYAVFVADRARVIGGANLAQKQLDLANLFVTRPEFTTKYPASLATADQFVGAVLATLQTDLGVNLSGQRTNLINLYNGSGGGRGAVMYRLADDNATNPIANQPFIDAEYNRSFVLGQYFGYLRRNPDIPGFLFWLGQVNGAALRDVPRQHAMVCSFITSGEFQLRFGPVASRNNNECPQ
jgi:photosystem II stability/assembly factor-like uncharacterized protein